MQYNASVTSPSSYGFPTLPTEYAYKCFPVRKVKGLSPTDGGAWLVEYRNDKLKQFNEAKLNRKLTVTRNDDRHRKILSGYYIIKHFHCNDPLDICHINICSEDLHSSDHEDFSLFTNVISIEANDNRLALETFSTFNNLETLELQLNSIKCLHLSHMHFNTLNNLDLSYNNLNESSLLELGKLRNLSKLTVRACGFKFLPAEMSRSYLINGSDSDETKEKSVRKTRYPSLTHLDLSENKLSDISTFASLAGLRRLTVLNLSHNVITGVPHLRLMVAQRHFSASTYPSISTARIVEAVYNENQKNDMMRHTVSKATNITKSPAVFPHQVLDDVTAMDIIEETGCSSNETGSSNVSDQHFIPDTSTDEDAVNEDVNLDSNHGASKNESETVQNETDLENVITAVGNDKNDVMNKDKSDVINVDILNINNENIVNPLTGEANVVEDFDIFDNLDRAISKISEQQNGDEVDDDIMFNFGKELNFSLAENSLDNLNLKLDSGQTIEEKFNKGDVEDVDEELKRPFQSLISLDLSCNRITEEESLLALTSWPALLELKLWNNPLVKTFKNTPPVISHHLEKMCGVSIIRKEPVIEVKRHFNLPKSNVRRVKADLPPIKRNNLLMIEHAIQKAVKDREIEAVKDREIEAVKDHEIFIEHGDDKKMKEVNNNKHETDDQNFFITQVDEVGMEDIDETMSEHSIDLSTEVGHYGNTISILDVLAVDDIVGDDVELPDTLQGSVIALKHILDHPLVFNRGEYANNYNSIHDQPKLKKLKKKRISMKNISPVKKDTLDMALEQIKLQDNKYEENLGYVLDEYSSNENIRNNFPQVKEMVKRVQKKYNKVRLESLRPIIRTQNELSQLPTRADKPSQELILSRMKQQRIGDMYATSRSNTPRSRLRERTPGKNLYL